MTSNKDTDISLLQCLKDKDLLSILRVNKYFYRLCDNVFWNNRSKIRFGLENTEGKENYRYIKRIYPFKIWLVKENFKSYSGSNAIQRIHDEEICVPHKLDCEGCQFCLYNYEGVGLRFLKYCKDNALVLHNHFDMKYIRYAGHYKYRNEFFLYKMKEIKRILNLIVI